VFSGIRSGEANGEEKGGENHALPKGGHLVLTYEDKRALLGRRQASKGKTKPEKRKKARAFQKETTIHVPSPLPSRRRRKKKRKKEISVADNGERGKGSRS